MRTLREYLETTTGSPSLIHAKNPILDAIVLEDVAECPECMGCGTICFPEPHERPNGAEPHDGDCPTCHGTGRTGRCAIVPRDAITAARVRICTACPGHTVGCDVPLSECPTATETFNGIAAALFGRVEFARIVGALDTISGAVLPWIVQGGGMLDVAIVRGSRVALLDKEKA